MRRATITVGGVRRLRSGRMRPRPVYVETVNRAAVLRSAPRGDGAAASACRRSPVALALACATALVACGSGDTPDNAALTRALAAHQSAEVTVRGTVVDVLPDAPAGSDGPHERFSVDLGGGTVVEIDHNLGLAARAPVRIGDGVVVHGQFEPDPGHPVIHYTHHATGHHEGGWIEVAGQRYQ